MRLTKKYQIYIVFVCLWLAFSSLIIIDACLQVEWGIRVNYPRFTGAFVLILLLTLHSTLIHYAIKGKAWIKLAVIIASYLGLLLLVVFFSKAFLLLIGSDKW